MKRFIHINRHVIQYNAKNGTDFPVCRVQEGNKSKYGKSVDIHGKSSMVYKPNDPLKCGAKLWIETDADVTIHGEATFAEIRNLMKQNLG